MTVIPPSLLVRVASGATALWNQGARLRVRLYQSGWLPQQRLNAKVISIGNLAWGGAGKTPFTLWLARRLQESGLRVSILTRGYRRSSRARVLIFPPEAPLEDAAGAGDEVRLYLRNLRNLRIPVGVSSSRYEAGRLIEGQFPVDVHLLDDGFQHLALHRDLDLVLVDAENPWGRRGPFDRLLREPPAALARADAILLTRCELAPASGPESLESLRAAVQEFHPHAPCFLVRTELLCFREWPSDASHPVAQFRARRPLAFCGLGNPSGFVRMLELAGIPLAATRTFPDHHRYTSSDLAALEDRAAETRADCLLTTEKDLVNLPAGATFRLPLYWAATEPAIEEEARLLAWIRERLGFSSVSSVFSVPSGASVPSVPGPRREGGREIPEQTVRRSAR